jgi:hypothetical protein
MEPAQVIEQLQKELVGVKAKGQDTVTIAALESYLDGLRSSASQSIEFQKLETQRSLAQLDVQTKHSIEMFKAVVESGREALNALVIVNGGAVIALLGFMGAVISKGLPQSLGLGLTLPILQFGIGVLMGAVGFMMRYFSQACYATDKKKCGDAFRWVAISVALIGYGLFGFGIYGAYCAFSIQFAL